MLFHLSWQDLCTDKVDEASDILRAAISATTIVEIRKVKSSLLELHGQGVSREEAETLLSGVNFINLEADLYHKEVGLELLAFLTKMAAYCREPEVSLEVTRRLKFVVDVFDFGLGKEEVESVAGSLQALTSHFPPQSKAYQSALALLKDLARNKALRSKKLHTIALDLLKELQQSGRKKDKKGRVGSDSVDFPSKFLRRGDGRGAAVTRRHTGTGVTEEEDGGLDYVDYMVELGEAGEGEVLGLETRLLDLGYEPNII